MKKKNKMMVSSIFVCFLCIGLVGFVWSKYNEIWFLKFNLDSEFSLAINNSGKVIQYIPLNQYANNEYNDSDFVDVSIDDVLENIINDDIQGLNLSVIDDSNNKINKHKNDITNIVKSINNKVNPSFLDVTEEEIKTYNKLTRINLGNARESVYNDLNIDISTFRAGKSNMVSHKRLSGANRFLTAINASKEIYPDGSDNVILVGEKTGTDGKLTTDLADGYLASSLANVLDAPILFVNKESVVSDLSTEINRLGASTIYLVGGSAVISDNVKNLLSAGRNVIRLTATGNGYSTDTGKIGTSISVANKVKEFKTYDSIILAPDKTDLIDSAVISFISAKEGIPIIYSSTSGLSSGISKFLTDNNINKVYLVGGSSFYNAVKSSIGEGKIVNLSGDGRYNTNTKIINQFYDSFDSIVLVNSSVELIPASQLANKTNSIVMYTDDDNKNEFVDSENDSQIDLIRNNNINNLYYLGNNKVKVAFRNLMYEINKKDCNNDVECLLFMKSRAVFYIPHQDDETSFHSQSILNAIKNLGAENVFVVFFTDGNSSGFTKDKELNRLLNKYGRTFSEQRDIESTQALLDFGVLPENIHFLEDLDFVNQSRFVDGDLRNNIDSLKKVMIAYDNKYGGDITHFSYTPYFDKHYDHLSLGQALMELYFDSTINDDSFSNVYSVIRVDVNDSDVYAGKVDDYRNYNDKILMLRYYNDDFKTRTINAIGEFLLKDTSVKIGSIEINGNSDVGVGYTSGERAFVNFAEYLDSNSLYTPIHVPFYKD